MKQMKKRIGSVLLAACMALTLLPCTALALDPYYISIDSSKYVASLSNLVVPSQQEGKETVLIQLRAIDKTTTFATSEPIHFFWTPTNSSDHQYINSGSAADLQGVSGVSAYKWGDAKSTGLVFYIMPSAKDNTTQPITGTIRAVLNGNYDDTTYLDVPVKISRDSTLSSVALYRDAAKIAATDTLMIPKDDTPNTYTYSATAFDKYGDELSGAAFTYSVTGTAPSGVDISTFSTNQTIKVSKGAPGGSTGLTIAAESTDSVKATAAISLTDPRSTAKAIDKFTLSGVDGTINETDHTIAVTVPYGTDVSNLTPTVTVSDNATVSPNTAQDFTNPVVYTVTAENESTQTYTVTVTIAPDPQGAKAITGFTLGGVNGTIDETNHTIAVTVPYGTDVTNLTPTVTVSDNATVSPNTAQDFSNPVIYTVTAGNGSTQDYTVTVTIAPDTRSTAKAITGFTLSGVSGTIDETNHTIAVTVPYGTDVTSLTPTITASEKATVTPTAAQDFTSPVVYTVTAENESTQIYTVTVTVAKNTAKAITGFTLSGVSGTIDETNHAIAVTVPFGTDVTSLTPTVTASANATVSPTTAQDFTSPVTYTVTAENESTQDYTVMVTIAPDTRSSDKAITGFTLGGTNGTIDEANHTIAVTLPYGTDVTSLTPAITASANATVSPATAQNFTSPVTYTVTAENESTQTYTVTVTVAKNSAKAIDKFTLSGVDGTVNETDHTIAVTLPHGTDVTSLTPTITASDKATVSPASGTAQSFTDPVIYTVTADDGTQQTYTVTVTVSKNSAKAITGFKIGSVDGTISEADHTIAVTASYGTDITSLTPTITASDKATVSPASGTAEDFTNPVIYTVTADDGTQQTYTVTVTVAKNSAKAITGFKIGSVDGTISEANHTIAVTLPYGTDVTSLTPTITASANATVSPTTAQDFTNPVVYTVTVENESTQTYTVTVTIAKNSAKAITGFKIGTVDGTISEADHTIAVTVPYGTDITSLTPTITASEKATVSPASGAAQSFTNPVTYTVTADNGSQQTYTVTVEIALDTRSSAKAITGFTLGGTNGTINETDHTIAVTLPYGTDVTSLTPTITASANAAVSPATAQNFTSPVTYTVTAENESTQDYTVTVTIAKNSAKAIIGFKIGSVNGTINETNQTIAVTLPFGTDVTNLTPTITVSDKAAVSPASGVAQNFTSPVTYTVTADDGSTQDYTVTVTVNAASSTGGDAGSGGPSSSGSTNSSSITVTTDAGTTTATQTVSATTGSNGVAAANVTKDQITDMMKVASEKAQAQNMQTSLEIKVDSGSGATGVSVTLPQAAVSTLTDGEASLTVSSTVATVTLDSTTLAEIGKQASGDVTITATAADTSALSADTKTAIGTRPVYDLKITSGSTTVSSFGGGTATVSVPYTPAAGEDVNAIVVYYINASGELVTVPNCVYDAKTGTVTFTTTHFSTYAVGYNAVSFSDVSDSAWYADYVAYLAARGIIGGNNGAFSPAVDITRAEFVTILARMSGDDLSGYKTSSFSDVSADSWYFTAVQWANKAGIASGYDGAFSPDATITREQMAAMLYRYAEYKGTVSNTEGMSVREFSDYDSISSWAQAPIQWAMNNDIISGNPDGSFAPSANATRAQAAKMISTLIQNII